MKLISIDSPTYLRRLVRALNNESSFYADVQTALGLRVVRCNRATLRAGRIAVRPAGDIHFTFPANHEFANEYGQSICASRVS